MTWRYPLLINKEKDMAELLEINHLAKQKWTFGRNWSKRTRQSFWIGMAFLMPWFIGFVLFTFYPIAASLVYSFSEYHFRKPLSWVGLDNYIAMFTDKLFWIALGNTLYMVALAVPVTLLTSFLCAVLLNLKVHGQSIYRVIYFLPSIVPTRSEEHTSELQSHSDLVCRLLLEKKNVPRSECTGLG